MLEISLTASLKEVYLVENESRGHVWKSDEPESIGGADEGPTPSELLLSSLASCKLITMRMYANRKEWDFQGATISLSIGEHAEKTTIEKSIVFKGDLDEDQIERLKVISGKCPVAKMLRDSVEFKFV
ncbi:MAG: putative redox protein [Crocinitomicaceae bacterium]